jgi:alpha-L-fucosidase 2
LNLKATKLPDGSKGWRINLWARLWDGNFGGAAGVVEMLLQSDDDGIYLLPALPDAWPSGFVSGICARGGFEISMKWEKGKLKSVEVLSKAGYECKLH